MKLKELFKDVLIFIAGIAVTAILVFTLTCNYESPKVVADLTEESADSLFDFRLTIDDPTLDSLLKNPEKNAGAIDSLQKLVLDENYEELDETAEVKQLKRLVIHCTASDVKNPHTKESLIKFFKEGRKWSKPGYTFFVDRQGNIWKLNEYWDWDPVINYFEITFGAKGYNSTSLHIAWDGGIDGNKVVDNRTDKQKASLLAFVKIAKDIYPNIEVVGHRDLPNVHKLCPIFDVSKEYKNLKF